MSLTWRADDVDDEVLIEEADENETALVGVVLKMPRLGQPLQVVVGQGRLLRSSVVEAVAPTADGVLIRTAARSYLLGPHGLLYRVSVGFHTAERAAEPTLESIPAIRPRPRVNRAVLVGGIAASLTLMAVGGAVAADRDHESEPRQHPNPPAEIAKKSSP
jgi:hypothetical protein